MSMHFETTNMMSTTWKIVFIAFIIAQVSAMKAFGRSPPSSIAFPYRPLAMEPSWDMIYRICQLDGNDDNSNAHPDACYGCFSRAYKYQNNRNEKVKLCHGNYTGEYYNICVTYLEENSTTCQYDKCMARQNTLLILNKCMDIKEFGDNAEFDDIFDCILRKSEDQFEYSDVNQFGNGLVVYFSDKGAVITRQSDIFKYNVECID